MRTKIYAIFLLMAAVIFALPSVSFGMAKKPEGTATTVETEADKLMKKTEPAKPSGREIHVSTTETKLPGDMVE